MCILSLFLNDLEHFVLNRVRILSPILKHGSSTHPTTPRGDHTLPVVETNLIFLFDAHFLLEMKLRTFAPIATAHL